jgi:hypothetical protein
MLQNQSIKKFATIIHQKIVYQHRIKFILKPRQSQPAKILSKKLKRKIFEFQSSIIGRFFFIAHYKRFHKDRWKFFWSQIYWNERFKKVWWKISSHSRAENDEKKDKQKEKSHFARFLATLSMTLLNRQEGGKKRWKCFGRKTRTTFDASA